MSPRDAMTTLDRTVSAGHSGQIELVSIFGTSFTRRCANEAPHLESKGNAYPGNLAASSFNGSSRLPMI